MKKIVTLMLALALVFALAACESQDYKKAMELYDSGDYAAAETVFLALGEYENSTEMVQKCRYQRASALYEAGNFTDALAIFLALGDFQNAADFVINCNYALAEAAMEDQDYGKAADLYEQLGDFKDCAQKEPVARYFQLYQYVQDKGETVDGDQVVQGEYTADGKTYTIGIGVSSSMPDTLLLKAGNTSVAVARFTYNVYLAIPHGAAEGRVEAESLISISFGGGVSTSAETFRGAVVLAECTPETQIQLESYSKYEQDANGKSSQTDDVSKAHTAELHTHFYHMIDGVEALLEKLSLGVTL